MNSYLIIKVEGKNITKFINRLRVNKINILNIKTISYKEIIIKINEKDYNKLLKLKTTYKITVINSDGFLKYKEIINKNKIFLLMLFIGILFLIFLSNTIFNIEVISNNNELNRIITNELKSYKIKRFSLKKSYDELNKIKDELKEKYKDNIEWIEITDIGTKYEVKIVERKKNKIKEIEEYSNIVASKSAVVKTIYAENGVKIVDLNTYVSKGDVIISGAITKGEEVKEYVHAKGKVYGEVWYNVSIDFPLNYTEKLYTNNKKKSFYIKLANKYISKKRYKNFERKSIIKLSNRLVPFEVGIENQKEIKIISDRYTEKEAKNKAIERAKEKVLQSLDTDEFIMEEKTLNFSVKESKIILEMFISCYEKIGKEEKIILEE